VYGASADCGRGHPSPTARLKSSSIKSPDDYFGFPLGADRKLLHWEQILEYFRYLAKESGRLKLIELGETTLGREFIMAVISSERNLRRLEHYRAIQRKLANPCDLSERELAELIRCGKVVALISMNIHSAEIAGSQTAVALAYHLLTDTSERTRAILDEVITLLVPSMNPDGQAIEVEWYQRNLGTKYEGCNLPRLYHPYAGQQTNRDLFMFNIRESQMIARVLYHDWLPQVVVDHHQMGVKPGPRIYVPPCSDPINPHLSPAIIAAINVLGTHITWDMIEQGYEGVCGSGRIQAQSFLGNFSGTPRLHNRIGILIETCSVHRATPVYHEPTEQNASAHARAHDPRPWRGGWWRLKDIINYQKAATLSILHCAATYRERFLAMFARLNREEVEAGETHPPYFYIIPAQTRDYLTTMEMLRKLSLAGVKILQLSKDVRIQGRKFEKGDYCIPLAQPARRYLLELFSTHRYPEAIGRRLRDVSTWNMPLLMDVEYFAVSEKVSLDLKEVECFSVPVKVSVPADATSLAFPCHFNHSFGLVQRLLDAGCDVRRAHADWKGRRGSIRQGYFVVQATDDARDVVGEFLSKCPIPVVGLKGRLPSRILKGLVKPKIGIYHYYTAYDTNQGWIKYLLDRYGIPHGALYHDDVDKPEELRRYNVVILPSGYILARRARRGPDGKPLTPPMPPRYRKYINRKRAASLLDWIERGGVLITLGSASDFLLRYTDVPVINLLEQHKGKAFVPGSLLRTQVERGHYFCYGYDRPPLVYTLIYPDSARGRAMYTLYPPVFKLARPSERIKPALRYAGDDLLVSGYAEGLEVLADSIIVLEVLIGDGRIVAFSFDPVYRCWTYGTFRLLLNAIYGSLTE
jgi:hypothetical protein